MAMFGFQLTGINLNNFFSVAVFMWLTGTVQVCAFLNADALTFHLF